MNPEYDRMFDKQMAEPVAKCGRCGGEIYGEPEDDGFGAMLCRECKEELGINDP